MATGDPEERGSPDPEPVVETGDGTVGTPDPERRGDRRTSRRKGLFRRMWIYPLLYLGLCGAMFLLQRTIQYPGDHSPAHLPREARDAGVREVELTTADGLKLYAWYQPGELPGTIVIFHGNGGHRGWRLDWMRLIRAQGPGVFLLDYRGYGGSEGSPTEEGLYLDAEAAIHWVETHASGPLVLMGESLGTGIAVEMARRHDPAGLILHASFTSTVDVARRHFFFLPVGWLMQDRYESDLKIGDIACPKLFLHGDQDLVIPHRFGQGLYQLAAEPKRWVQIQGAGHNDLHTHDVGRYYGAIREFVDEVLRD